MLATADGAAGMEIGSARDTAEMAMAQSAHGAAGVVPVLSPDDGTSGEP
jgi:hypothetical protein